MKRQLSLLAIALLLAQPVLAKDIRWTGRRPSPIA